jgi:hypothetical protein
VGVIASETDDRLFALMGTDLGNRNALELGLDGHRRSSSAAGGYTAKANPADSKAGLCKGQGWKILKQVLYNRSYAG